MSTLFFALYALKNNNKPGNNIRRLRTIWWDKPHQIHSVSGTESHTLTYTLTLIAHREIFRMTKKKKTTKENVCQKQKIIVIFVLFCGERGRRRWSRSRTTNDFIIVARCFDVSSSVGWFVGSYTRSELGKYCKNKRMSTKVVAFVVLCWFSVLFILLLLYVACDDVSGFSVRVVLYRYVCVCVRALSCVCVLFIIIDLPRQLFCNIIYIYNFILLTDITFTGFCSCCCCCYCCRCHVILFNYMLSSGLRPTSSLEFLG